MRVALIEGATDAELFETYVERLLAPSLSEGQVVVLDGLGAHRTARVRDLIEERGQIWFSCRPTRRTSTP